MRIERFEDVIAWQKAKGLAVQIYTLFESSKDFGFKDQIQRAAVSVMNNIAEGFERKGNEQVAQGLNPGLPVFCIYQKDLAAWFGLCLFWQRN